MSVLPDQLRDLMTSGPMAHLTTINADGSPQVSVIWIGVEGEEPVSGHLGPRHKLRNIERDSRVVLSFDAPREPGVFLNPYAVPPRARHGRAQRPRVGSPEPAGQDLRLPRRRVPRTERAGVHRAVRDRADRWSRPVGNQPRHFQNGWLVGVPRPLGTVGLARVAVGGALTLARLARTRRP